VAATSVIPAVKSQFLALLEARSPIAESRVTVTYSRPANLDREAIFFTGVRFRHDLPVIRAGRKPRDEVFTLMLAINAAKPGRTAEQAELRAFELLAAVEDMLADDPRLGGTLVEWARMDDGDAGVTPDFEGWDGLVRVGIECHARLT